MTYLSQAIDATVVRKISCFSQKGKQRPKAEKRSQVSGPVEKVTVSGTNESPSLKVGRSRTKCKGEEWRVWWNRVIQHGGPEHGRQ